MKKLENSGHVPAVMAGECFEHDLRWFSGGIECPVCKAKQELSAFTDAIRKAQTKLRATQANWQEECLFECDEILSNALKGGQA